MRSNFDIFAAAGGRQHRHRAVDQQRHGRPAVSSNLTLQGLGRLPVHRRHRGALPGHLPGATPPLRPPPTGLTGDGRAAPVSRSTGRQPGDRPDRLPRLPVDAPRPAPTPSSPATPVAGVDLRRHDRRPAERRRTTGSRPIDSSENESAPSATVSVTPPLPPTDPDQHRWPGPDGRRHHVVGLLRADRLQRLGHRRQPVQRGRHHHRHPGGDEQHHLPVGVDRRQQRPAVGARAFGFAVPVNNGYYRVRLHFAELNKTAANTRLFDVRLENTTVLSNFDVWAAGRWHRQGDRPGVPGPDHRRRGRPSTSSRGSRTPRSRRSRSSRPRSGHHGSGRGDRGDRHGRDLRHHGGLVGQCGHGSGRVQRVPGEPRPAGRTPS